MRAWAGGLLIAAGLLTGCGGDDDEKVAKSAEKPLPTITVAPRPPELKAVPAGGDCPVSKRRRLSSGVGHGLGKGPVYAAGFDRRSGLEIDSPRSFKSDRWGGGRMRLLRRPGTPGTIVVRGWQLDGPEIVRFERGRTGTDVLTWSTKAKGWQDLETYTRVVGPGCYAMIIDGPRIHQVVTFQAR